MKLKIKKPFYNLLIANIILVNSAFVYALQHDTNQLVVIDSLKEFIDIKNNISTFSKNVVIKQGTIELHADKVFVSHPVDDQDKTYIEAFGEPVTFYQIQENGSQVKGHAKKVRYDVQMQLLTLTGNAYLEQLNNNVTSDHITYLVRQKQMQAFSDKGKFVTTVLVPSYLQDKNKKNKSN